MKFIKWMCLAVLSLVAMCFGYVLFNWLGAAISTALRMDRLPWWLSWFDTPDNPLDGDGGWRDEHLLFLNSNAYGFKRWLKRTLWLYRNCAYGFSESVCGAKLATNMPVRVYGDPFIQNRPHGKAGWFYATVGDDRWCFMFVMKWPFVGICFRVYFGWKVKPEAELDMVAFPVTRMLVFTGNPFMGFVKE